MKKKANKRIRSVNPDAVSDEFPRRAIRLMTRIIPAEPVEPPGESVSAVLIEGDALSLEYFGKWVLVQAGFLPDCGVGISPKGAGSAFFNKHAEVGIYIHRLPCLNPIVSKKSSKSGRTKIMRAKQK